METRRTNLTKDALPRTIGERPSSEALARVWDAYWQHLQKARYYLLTSVVALAVALCICVRSTVGLSWISVLASHAAIAAMIMLTLLAMVRGLNAFMARTAYPFARKSLYGFPRKAQPILLNTVFLGLIIGELPLTRLGSTCPGA